MSRIRKRLSKIMNNPNGVKWDELKTICEYYGMIVESPNGGSHFMVYHPNDPEKEMLPPPVHDNRIKKVYVKRIISIIERSEGDD